MKREELDAIRQRAEAATKGNPLKDFSVLAKSNRVIIEDVPALLKEVERLNEWLSKLISAIYEYEPNGTALMDLAEEADADD